MGLATALRCRLQTTDSQVDTPARSIDQFDRGNPAVVQNAHSFGYLQGARKWLEHGPDAPADRDLPTSQVPESPDDHPDLVATILSGAGAGTGTGVRDEAGGKHSLQDRERCALGQTAGVESLGDSATSSRCGGAHLEHLRSACRTAHVVALMCDFGSRQRASHYSSAAGSTAPAASRSVRRSWLVVPGLLPQRNYSRTLANTIPSTRTEWEVSRLRGSPRTSFVDYRAPSAPAPGRRCQCEDATSQYQAVRRAACGNPLPCNARILEGTGGAAVVDRFPQGMQARWPAE